MALHDTYHSSIELYKPLRHDKAVIHEEAIFHIYALTQVFFSVFLFLTYFTLYDRLYVYPCLDKWSYSIPFYGWVILQCTCVLVAQSYLTLCNPMDCSLPGSFVHGILQAWILEWVTMPLSRDSSQFRDQIQVSLIAGRFFTIWATQKPLSPNPVYICTINEMKRQPWK